MRPVIRTVLAALVLSACSAPREPSGPEAPSASPDERLPSFKEGSLDQRIAAAVHALETSPCHDNPTDTTACPRSSFPLEPGAGHMAKSTGEAVLIVDELGRGSEPFLSLYRHANRIVGYYVVNPEGGFDEAHPALNMPTVLGQVLTGFADQTFVPSALLSPIADAVGRTSKFGGAKSSHGNTTFMAIADFVPEQPIVLVSGGFGPVELQIEDFCKLFTSDAALEAFRAREARVRDNLRAIMAKHNVRFVNASFGDTTDTLLRELGQRCPGLTPDSAVITRVLQAIKPQYEALFATDGVFATHAAGDNLGPEVTPYDVPTPDFPNRLRVGVAYGKDLDVDPDGRADAAALAQLETVPSTADAELFISSGCAINPMSDCGRWAQVVINPLSLSMIPLGMGQPSWVTPVALARFISLRYERHAAEPMTNALIATIKDEMRPAKCGADGSQRCIVQDPIRHHQLELYRLGYLPK